MRTSTVPWIRSSIRVASASRSFQSHGDWNVWSGVPGVKIDVGELYGAGASPVNAVTCRWATGLKMTNARASLATRHAPLDMPTRLRVVCLAALLVAGPALARAQSRPPTPSPELAHADSLYTRK